VGADVRYPNRICLLCRSMRGFDEPPCERSLRLDRTLWKGAASQAIQNLNRMLGLPEGVGIS